jgi:hypothetical protein
MPSFPYSFELECVQPDSFLFVSLLSAQSYVYNAAEVQRKRAEADAKRKADEAEAKRKQEVEIKRKADEAEAKRKQEAEVKRKADEAETKRKQEAEAKRQLDEAEAKRKQEAQAKRKADHAEAMRVAASDITAHLQRALSASSVALLVAALSAADATSASHPQLYVAHPQVAALRTEAHTRAAATAENAIRAALALGDSNSGTSGVNSIHAASVEALEAALASAESVPSAVPPTPAVESLRAAVANVRRVAAYWSLRLRKADHTQWTCDEVVVAFTAVAHSNSLRVDSINAVIAYFKAELPDGSFLAAMGTDDSYLAHIVSDKLRRVRVSKVINEICTASKLCSHAHQGGGGSGAQGHAQPHATGSPFAATHASSSASASKPAIAIAVGGGSADSDDEKSDGGAVYGPSMSPSASLLWSSSSSSSADVQNLAARLVDTDESLFEAGLSPVQGIATAEQLSFADAVKRCGVKGMALNIKCAAKHGATMKNHGKGGALSADHIAAIHMYTQACDFYRTLNACLRHRNRDTIKPFFSYLRLLLEALRQLPSQKRTVYRGVKLDLSAKFREGDEPVWWSVSSTSTTMKVLQSKEFCGDDGPRTVFVVEAAHARDIASFSAFASEEELILLPGAQLRVKAVLPMGGGLHLVQMDEVDEPMSLIEFEDEK